MANSMPVNEKGFTVLYEASSPIIDLVFVHGFTGHPKDTWTLKGAKIHFTSTADNCTQDDRSTRAAEPSRFRKLRFASRRSTSDTTHTNLEVKQQNEVYWPADLAPHTIPDSRILTYGYDTKVRHWAVGPVSQSGVYDHAQDFLSCLEHQRRRPSEIQRPVLFIAHSLGGIVVKEALRISRGCGSVKPHIHGIFEATIGIMFFGTPHAGADPRSFLHHVLTASALALGAQVNKKIVGALMPGAEVLARLRDDFSLMCHERKWSVYSFQEEYGVPALFGTRVVDDQSSCLNDPTIETKQRISSNHMDMCRFYGSQDQEYLKVAAALKFILGTIRARPARAAQQQLHVSPRATQNLGSDTDMDDGAVHLESAATERKSQAYLGERIRDDDKPPPTARRGIPAEIRDALVKQLYFAKIDERLTSLAAAQGTSCRWFLDKPEYASWRDFAKRSDHGGFLWIKGNPGTGKSTLIKLLFEETKRRTKDDSLHITLSFFFLARGTVDEKSTMGLYRSILHQLFQQADELVQGMEWMTIDGAKGIQSNGWNEPALKHTLTDSVRILGERSLTIFVDALDECEDSQAKEMISFFEELCEMAQTLGAQLRICFSSRHYPHIEINKGIEVVLEDEVGHKEDIEQYIRSKLRVGKQPQAVALQSEILEKSCNIFLWVVLVVNILNSEYPSKPIPKMRQRLREIPPKLADLFEMILTRDGENLDLLQISLKWILFANRPLNPQEFYFGVQFSLDEGCSGSWDLESEDLDSIKAFVRTASKGLAEVTRNEASNVQFIHESVREFLLGKHGNQWFEAADNIAGHSHELLRDCCLSQVKAVAPQINKIFGTDQLRQYPFLAYATHNVLHHADRSQRCGIDQTLFLGGFGLSDWIAVHNAVSRDLEESPSRQYQTPVSLLYVLAERNLTDLIKIYPFKESCFAAEKKHYGPPILAAVATESDDAVQALFSLELKRLQWSEPQIQELHKQYPGKRRKHTGIGLKFREERGVFSYVAECCDESMVAFLLKTSKVDVNASFASETPLWYATLAGHEAIAQVLVEKGAAVNIANKRGQSLLSLASQGGHEAIARLLIENGSRVNSNEPGYWTPLLYAAENGDEAIVRLLLENGADLVFENGKKRSALIFAVARGHEEVVSLLLEKGAEVNWSDISGRSPLSWAAGRGHEAIARLLIRCGAAVDSKDHYHQTPLTWAVIARQVVMVKILLEFGADPNIRGLDGNTPLVWAIGEGERTRRGVHISSGKVVSTKAREDMRCLETSEATIVSLLLAFGANPNALSGDGQTLLRRAYRKPDTEILSLLLENGANIESKVLDLLLKAGADVNSVDGNGSTALLLATASRERLISVTKLLLESEADLERADDCGRTPLSYAVENRHLDAVKASLENDAILDSMNEQGRTQLVFAAGKRRSDEARPFVVDHTAKNSPFDAKDHGFGIGRDDFLGVELLLGSGAVTDSTDSGGRTPLSWACGSRRAYIHVVKALLSKGAALESRDHQGRTPLSYAAETRHPALVQFLLWQGAAVDSKDHRGRTPLSFAVEGWAVGTVNSLLDGGAVIESEDEQGRTALSIAAEKGGIGVVEFLLRRGALVDHEDKQGWTALDWAGAARETQARLLHMSGEGGRTVLAEGDG
ncbi:ankyrin repeat-containing domain protein [Cercophora newfieldiana]|uniref:Ankyrin repeat-containing domain protein n=1 Tax=Cercophora newfieldiana TaxID=92897 RepID=A0AA39XV82_9PEZI|nr:ankyrin repeat-containing domain protein [Cercophora newfieldiana]